MVITAANPIAVEKLPSVRIAPGLFSGSGRGSDHSKSVVLEDQADPSCHLIRRSSRFIYERRLASKRENLCEDFADSVRAGIWVLPGATEWPKKPHHHTLTLVPRNERLSTANHQA
jgi:hypothetical protein